MREDDPVPSIPGPDTQKPLESGPRCRCAVLMRWTASMTVLSTAPMAPAIPHMPRYLQGSFLALSRFESSTSGCAPMPAVLVGIDRARRRARSPLSIWQEAKAVFVHHRVVIGSDETRGASFDGLQALGLPTKDQDRLVERRRLFLDIRRSR